jgi:hypothetical protein
MSLRDLRRDPAEIDDDHNDSVGTSRRRFLRRAAAGGAVALGAGAVGLAAGAQAAGAQAPGTTSGTAKPTGAAGKKPTIEGEDLSLIVFAHSVELAAVAIYDAILATRRLDTPGEHRARTFQLHHRDHAAKLATFAGSEASTTPDASLVDEFMPRLQQAGTAEPVIDLAQKLEERLAATYANDLGRLAGWEVAGAVSTILPVESEQAVVWSRVLEPDPTEWAKQIKTWIPAFQTGEGALRPNGSSPN